MRVKILLTQSWLVKSIGRITTLSVIIFFLIFGLSTQAFYTASVLSTSSQMLSNQIDGQPAKSIQTVTPIKTTSLGLPVRLKIPKIKLDARLESVGLTFDGAMEVPKGPSNAAWFNLGPRPGERGSAVIDGHFGRWKNGQPTVFNNLYKLRKGDKIYVKDKKGATVAFVVRELRSYGGSDDASDVFGSSDSRAHLNLITCEGVWDKVSKSYSKRLVVFTDRETD